ncbi:hypothetical protein P7D22_19425 [Lichenihabitans sp. Uapishka_5]|uniref:hypothetical protein n=1 Tax=Lichenihabitans sp. Uapishka_5 TaxID=3037302 RepID=UPI0029E7F4FF|nr:hypothetical protein [Lichenihabitans sp. Uapishka_5]MDX7953339.1 hypothetical protein [Lichenihabitans sp. Uapishka_5]
MRAVASVQAVLLACALTSTLAMTTAARAEPSYPFLGTWVRSDRACTPTATRERTYTPKEVISSRSRCSIRRVAHGSGGYEVFERCERPGEKPAAISEIIRMTGPDTMVVVRQTTRLKLSRGLRYTRCGPVAAPAATPTVKPH